MLPLQISPVQSLSLSLFLLPSLSALIHPPLTKFPTLLILSVSAYVALSPASLPELGGHRLEQSRCCTGQLSKDYQIIDKTWDTADVQTCFFNINFKSWSLKEHENIMFI